MAIVLKVTPEKLIQTSQELENQGTQMHTLTDQMISLVSEIAQDVWSGDAAVSYKAKFSSLQDDMTRITRMVQAHVQDLQEMARSYTEAETANQEIASTLTTDVIV